MKRLLFSLVAGAALVTTTSAQDTTPRQDRPEDRQEERQDRRDNARDRQDDRRDNAQNDRRDNVPGDRRDNSQNDRRDNVQTERRDDRRDNVQTERRDDRRDNVQTERRDDRRDNVQTERRDDRRDGVQAERRDNAQAARELRGRVVRTGEGQFVVQTPDNRQVTVYTNQRTRYLQGNQPAQFSNLRVGSTVNFGYAMEGERYIADTVTLVPATGTTTTTTEQVPAAGVPAQPAQGTVVQGEIARVIGQDQVVIRTADGKEVIVYVNPQTTYQLNPQQPGRFTDLRPGAPVAVDYNAVNQRNTARRFFAPRRDR